MDCSPPGSSVCEISQARILEWVAISFSSVLIIVFHRCDQIPFMYSVAQCYKVEVLKYHINKFIKERTIGNRKW